MARRYCQRCRAQLNEGDHFCGNCGAPTKLGLKQLDTSEKLNLTLSQLERSYQAGYTSKAKYEEQKAKYSEELARLNNEINARRPATPQNTTAALSKTTGEPTYSDAKSAVIYADPPQLHLHDATGYLIAAVVIVGVSLWLTWGLVGEGFESVWIDQWYLLAFSLVGPAIYLFWMWRADKFEREPIYFVVLILGWGVFAAFLSLVGNSVFDEIGLGAAWLGAPIIEESMKAIGVYLMAKNPEFNDSMDGIVYGFASGMGFAWAENFFYIVLFYEGDLTWSLLRVFIFSLGHGLYTAYTGWSLGRAKVKKGYVTPGDLRLGLAMAMIAHAIYNSDIYQVDSYESLAIWVVLTLGTLSLILYALVRRSWEEEKKWHYDDGYAPKAVLNQ
jgi:RsiW-degrading membrane proteinase PrsW (M82 family)